MRTDGDYISRELAKKTFRDGKHTVKWLIESGAKTIGDSFAILLDEVPAANVQPVGRGKWIKYAPDNSDMMTCSECEKYWILDGEQYDFHFCPNCGADMRGEAE